MSKMNILQKLMNNTALKPTNAGEVITFTPKSNNQRIYIHDKNGDEWIVKRIHIKNEGKIIQFSNKGEQVKLLHNFLNKIRVR